MSEKTAPIPSPEKVRFIYKKLEDCESVYINGVQGGMSPRGELVCNFFFEYMDAPTMEMDPVKNGQIIVEKAQVIHRGGPAEGEIIFKRDIKVRLIIPAQQISSIANWMLDTLKTSGITVEKSEK